MAGIKKAPATGQLYTVPISSRLRGQMKTAMLRAYLLNRLLTDKSHMAGLPESAYEAAVRLTDIKRPALRRGGAGRQ